LPTATERGGGSRALALAVPAALALLHLAFALAAYNPAPHLGGDNATYVSLAQSLVQRGEMVQLWDPAVRIQALYPPLFPAVLAAAMKAGLESYLQLKYVVIAFSALGVAWSYLWMRCAGPPRVALIGGLWLAAAPGIVDFAHWVLSDVPFWALTSLALWAWARAEGSPPTDTSIDTSSLPSEADPPTMEADAGVGLGWVAVAAAATLAAQMTRSAGLPLVLAAGVWLVGRRRWRGLAVYAAVVAPVMVGWNLRGRAAGGGGAGGVDRPVFPWAVDPYRPDLGNVTPLEFLGRVHDNVVEYATHHLPLLLTGDGRGRAAAVLGAGVAVLAFVGWVRRLRRPGVAEVWLPTYLGLILVWPQNWSGERLILPTLPMLLLCALQAAHGLAAPLLRGPVRRRPRLAPAALAASAACVLAVTAPGLRRTSQAGGRCRASFAAGERFPCLTPAWHDFFHLAERVRGRLPAGSVVISRKPTLWYMLAGYRSRVYPFSAVPDTLLHAARQAGARYVVEDQIIDLAPLYLHPILRARPHAFCAVPGMSLPYARLLRIVPAGETPAPGDSVRGEEHIPPCPAASAG
jgi:hypothetical protein